MKTLTPHLRVRYCGWGSMTFLVNLIANPFLNFAGAGFGDIGLAITMGIGFLIALASLALVLYGIYR